MMDQMSVGAHPVTRDAKPMNPVAAEFIEGSTANAGTLAMGTGYLCGCGVGILANWMTAAFAAGTPFPNGWLLPAIGVGMLVASEATSFVQTSMEHRRFDKAKEVVQTAAEDDNADSFVRVSPQALFDRTQHEVLGSKAIGFMSGFSIGFGTGAGGAMILIKPVSSLAPYFTQMGLGLVASLAPWKIQSKHCKSLRRILSFGKGSDNTCG